MLNVIDDLKLEQKTRTRLTPLVKDVKEKAKRLSDTPINILSKYWTMYNEGTITGYDRVTSSIVEYVRYVLDINVHYYNRDFKIDPTYRQQILYQLDNIKTFNNEDGKWSSAKDEDYMFYYLKYTNWLSKIDSGCMEYLRDLDLRNNKPLAFHITLIGIDRTRLFIEALRLLEEAMKYAVRK